MFLASLLLAAAVSQPLTDPEYGPAPGYRHGPSVASDGENFLAAWYDQRREPGAVYAARIDRDGNALDRTGIRLQDRAANPRVVFAAGAYVVLWFTSEDGGHRIVLWAARIDRDGAVIDGPRVVDQKGATNTMTIAAATNGRRIIVVWNDYYDILDAEARLIARNRQLPRFEPPVIATNGTTFLTSTADRGTVLDADGNIAATVQLSGSFPPTVAASDGEDYLLAGGNPSNGPYTYAFSQRITAAGVAGEPIALPAPIQADGRAQLAWTGSSYLLVRDGAALARLDRTGALVKLLPIDAGYFYNNYSSIAVSGGRAMFVQTNNGSTSGTVNLRAFPLDESAAALGVERLVSQAALAQTSPSIASSGSGHAVTWREEGLIRVARLGVDRRGVVVGPGTAPRIVFDGRNYVVAWIAGQALRLTRVDPQSGAVLDPAGIDIAGASAFDMETDGTDTVIASITSGSSAVRITRVNRFGQATLSVMASPESMRTSDPSLAWNGTEWLVAFSERVPVMNPFYPIPSYLAHVRAVRLTSDLIVRDAAPIAVAENEGTPLAASDGSGFLIVSRGYSGLVARRLGGEPRALGAGYATDVLWDGTRYALVFGTDAGVFSLAYLDASGAMLGGPEIFGPSGGNAALARGASGVTIAFARMSHEPLYGAVTRIFVAATPFTPPRGRAVRAR